MRYRPVVEPTVIAAPALNLFSNPGYFAITKVQ